MVLGISLLNTQHYKVRFKVKMEQSRERSSIPSYTSVQYLLKRELSGSPRLWSLTLLTFRWLNSFIWPIDKTLTGTISSAQSGHGSNGNEGVHCILHSSSTGASPLDTLVSYPEHSLEAILSLGRDAVSVFYRPIWLRCICLDGWLTGFVVDWLVQILDESVCISHGSNTLGKVINPNILLPDIGKIVGKTGLFNLSMATDSREGKLN